MQITHVLESPLGYGDLTLASIGFMERNHSSESNRFAVAYKDVWAGSCAEILGWCAKHFDVPKTEFCGNLMNCDITIDHPDEHKRVRRLVLRTIRDANAPNSEFFLYIDYRRDGRVFREKTPLLASPAEAMEYLDNQKNRFLEILSTAPLRSPPSAIGR